MPKWSTSQELKQEIESLYAKVMTKEIDSETARNAHATVGLFLKQEELEIKVAKMQGRFKGGTDSIPPYKR